MTEHTKDKLASALREVGLDDMAAKAATGYYHDFLSPLDLPELTLIDHLGGAARANPATEKAILALQMRVMDGDFDATAAESEEWTQSPEGREAFRRLLGS
ncbi:hypothetical protein [Bradyrhizobium ottawaense]|uniref:hypothetical protein n=1 Tax=Bradyrhizobium ottawaense TaxID=931866 RepID=UPI0030F43ACF